MKYKYSTKRITFPKLENVKDQPSVKALLNPLLFEKMDINESPKKAVTKKLSPYCTNIPISGINAKIMDTIM